MMNQPALGELMRVVETRYSLVIVAARRARGLLDGEPARTNVASTRPVTIALHEIAARHVQPTIVEDGD